MTGYLLEEDCWPKAMTRPQRERLRVALSALAAREDVCGVAVGGSFASGLMDEFSDLDVTVVVETAALADIPVTRWEIARELGPVLVCFTGEHIGRPDLLICLYGPPPVHVDLGFVGVDAFRLSGCGGVVVWARREDLRSVVSVPEVEPLSADPQWIEDRMWHWIHYAATRVGRGDLFEALRMLDMLRSAVLGPLALAEMGVPPHGVKKVERLAPARADQMRATVAFCEAASIARGLQEAVSIYRSLRSQVVRHIEQRSEAEKVAVGYLEEIARRLEVDGERDSS